LRAAVLTGGSRNRIRVNSVGFPAAPSPREQQGAHGGGGPAAKAVNAPRGRPPPRNLDASGARAGQWKGALAVIYGEPDTPRFLAAVQRLKRQQRKRERQTRQAKLRVREALRKMREC
jgi:hypothetical protein